MAGDFGNRRVHLLADPAVGRVTLGGRTKLDDVHRLPSVHVHVEPDAISHDDGVCRGIFQTSCRQRLVQRSGAFHHFTPVYERAGLLDCRRLNISVGRRERLPFERQQSMPLQIPEGAVIGQNVEPVARALERAPWAVL